MQLRSKHKFDTSNLLPLFVLVTLGVEGLNLLLGIGNMVQTAAIAHKPVPSLVQLLDGRSARVEPAGEYERTPQVIKTFVRLSLGMIFTWNAQIALDESNPGATGKTEDDLLDRGIPIDRGRVTTATWQASFALSEDFRAPFLEQVAKMTPADVFNGKAQSVLSIEHISDPKWIEEGRWKVDLVAYLLIFDSTHPGGLAIPFNKTVFVEATTQLPDPLPEITSPIQKAVHRVRESGLQITEIQDLGIRE